MRLRAWLASLGSSAMLIMYCSEKMVCLLLWLKQKEVAKTLTMLEDIWDEYQVYESDEIDYIDDSVKIHYAKLEEMGE